MMHGIPDGPLWDLARNAGRRWEASWAAWSGADQAEGEVWRYVRDIYVTAAQGGDVEAAITTADQAWRAYAEANNRKIADAPKIRRGPSAGHSSIGHRYTSPVLLQTKLIHVRAMIRAHQEVTA
jgi:hypothetical protein